MGMFDRFFPMNPFAKYFKGIDQETRQKEDIEIKNSQGLSEIESQWANLFGTQYQYSTDVAGMVYTGVMFEQYFGSKASRVSKYREMAYFPEISDALDMICNEAIVEDPHGNIITLNLNDEVPSHIEEQLRNIWDYLITDVWQLRKMGWDLFRKWIVDGEIYVEQVLNDEGNNIIGIKVLPVHTMLPIYEENKIKGYVQTKVAGVTQLGVNQGTGIAVSQASTTVNFDQDQVVYANYGLYGENFLDNRGFLESAIRTYNQLKNLEDSLVIYRLVRAPERRVWNIAVGRMPKGKAEEYIKGMIQRYRKRIIYNPETGAMDSTQNIQAMTEDFWFGKNEAGEGTTVETIGGNMSLGEIEDVKYFLNKLYKVLKLPKSRWDSESGTTYVSGKSGEILREEINFSLFVQRLQNRYSNLILKSFMTLLKLRGIDKKYINEDLYNIQFNRSNLFKEYREMELIEAKIALLAAIDPFIYNKEANPKGYFAPEFAIRKYMHMSDEDWNENEEMLLKIKGEAGPVAGEAVPGMDAGFGADTGGGDMGGGAGGAEMGGAGAGVEGLGAEAGGAGAAPEAGGAVAGVEAGAGAVAPTAGATPESIEFKADNQGDLFTAWLLDDNLIKNRHTDKGFIDTGDKLVQ